MMKNSADQAELALLYFDLLGMRSLIEADVFEAARDLSHLSLLLSSLTRDSGWLHGFHLSDSTMLVHTDPADAVIHALQIWKRLFEFTPRDLTLPDFVYGLDAPYMDSNTQELSCLPRGCLVMGDVKLLPRIQWTSQGGFERTQREILLDHVRLGPVDRIALRRQEADLVVEDVQSPEGDMLRALYVKRVSDSEQIWGLAALDPGGDLDVLYVAEIGNVTGTALVRAVKYADGSNLKGPRLLLGREVVLPAELGRYVRPVPEFGLSELLWTVNFEDPSQTTRYLLKAYTRWEEHLDSPFAVRIHYDALLCIAIHGVAAVFGSAQAKPQLIRHLQHVLSRIPDGKVDATDSVAAVTACVLHYLSDLEENAWEAVPHHLLPLVPTDRAHLLRIADRALAPIQ